MRKIIRIVPVFLLAALLAGLSGCNKKQLRQPPTTGNSGGGGGLNLNKAELMEVAREMGKVIGREVAREINANTVKVQLPSEPEVAQFYRKYPKAFRIATPADIPANLEWQDGEGSRSLPRPTPSAAALFMITWPISRARCATWARTRTARFARTFSITTW
jgi:hypothetical protein